MRAVLSALVVVWVTITLTFFALRLIPGDAISAQLAQGGASQAAIEAERARLGLDDPVYVQYGRYLLAVLRGELGESLVSGLPVNQIISQRWGPTVTLALWGLVVAAVVGVGCGVLAAFVGWPARVSRLLITLSISTPIYWTGTLAIILFSVQLNWLPSTGTGRWQTLILPVGVLAFHTMGEIARLVQIGVSETRGAAFVTVARGRGLPERRITLHHILRVALLPVITVIALQAGFLLSGAVITESLFVRPGIGRLLLDSAINQDYPVVQGIVILAAVVYTLANLLADLSYRLLDPRLTD